MDGDFSGRTKHTSHTRKDVLRRFLHDLEEDSPNLLPNLHSSKLRRVLLDQRLIELPVCDDVLCEVEEAG